MKRSQKRRIVIRSLSFGFLGATAGIVVGAAIVLLTQLPEVSQLERYEPKGVTVLKDIHGHTMREIYTEKRIPVSLDQVPLKVQQAFLAAEDWRFYEHFGVDVKGLLRASVKNILEGKYVEGASTITQQLAKVLFLSPEKTLARKLKEALLAIQIERHYSKHEILTLYLNQIYLGAGCYGVEAAARNYFGTSIKELSIAQIALLAGLPKAPNRFSPFQDPEAARMRRETILTNMVERNVISKEEFAKANESPIVTHAPSIDKLQSYFSEIVLRELEEKLGEEKVYRGHLDVETTLDDSLQRLAEASVKDGVSQYAKRHGLSLDATDKLPQGALIAIDHTTGEIRALVGGRSFSESQFNRAAQALRQPGSAFKPILYAAALSKGLTQASLIEDAPIEFQNRQSGKWSPKNYDHEYSGFMPLRTALEKSKNTVAVRLLQTVGIPALQKMAQQLGINSPIAYNLSSALGSSSVTLLELTRAYATLANGGMRPTLQWIRNVRGVGGANLWPLPEPAEPAVDPKTAFVLTDMLSGVIQSGTGFAARDLPCAVAGKTGTTDDNIDSLFVGFSSNLTVGSWVGFDERKSLGPKETGAVAALPIWKAFMETACESAEAHFSPPPGIVMVDVDHSNGKKAGKFCTDVVPEAFIEGSEPKDICDEEEIPQT